MKRRELYALVWGEPVYLLARRFGRSGRGLSKLCARYNIPVPPRGYWNKRNAGYSLPTLELPEPDRDPPVAELLAFDGAGRRMTEAEMPDEWVIPGVLKRVFPGFLPTGTADTSAHAPQARQPSIAASARSGMSGDEQTENLTKPQSKKADARGPRRPRNPDSVVARRRELENAMSLAMRWKQHLALHAFLDAVESAARALDAEAKEALTDWVRVVRLEADAVDPVASVISNVEDAISSRLGSRWR